MVNQRSLTRRQARLAVGGARMQWIGKVSCTCAAVDAIGHKRAFAKGSFPAFHIAVLVSEVSWKVSPESGHTKAGTHQ